MHSIQMAARVLSEKPREKWTVVNVGKCGSAARMVLFALAFRDRATNVSRQVVFVPSMDTHGIRTIEFFATDAAEVGLSLVLAVYG